MVIETKEIIVELINFFATRISYLWYRRDSTSLEQCFRNILSGTQPFSFNINFQGNESKSHEATLPIPYNKYRQW